MHDLMLESAFQRAADMHGHSKRRLPIQHAGRADSLNDLSQAFAVHEVHRDPAVRPQLPGVPDAHNVGMPNGLHRFHRADEAPHLALVFRELGLEYFHSHALTADSVAGLKDHPGAGFGDRLVQAKTADRGADQFLQSLHGRLGGAVLASSPPTPASAAFYLPAVRLAPMISEFLATPSKRSSKFGGTS